MHKLFYFYFKRIIRIIHLISIVIFIISCESEEPEPESIVIDTECGDLFVSFEFTSSYFFSPGFEVVFTNKSTPTNNYYWDFGDGTFSYEYSPTHIFEQKQNYNVTLTINNLCSDTSIVRTLYIGQDTANYAKACFEVTSSFYFEAGSTIKFSDCSKNTSQVNWYFGDNASSMDTAPTHIFETEGVYLIKQVVSNFYSSDSLTKEIHITKKSKNYIDFNSQLFELKKIKLSEKVSADIQNKTIRLKLASNEISFPQISDSTWLMEGRGSAVYFEWVVDEDLHTGFYSHFTDAWMIPNYAIGQTNSPIDLKEGTIEILQLNPLEFIYRGDIATIYYKDTKFYDELTLSLSELESLIRKSQDPRATFTFDQYEQLLKKLSNPKFSVMTINEMNTTYDPSKIVVGLRHDVDCHPFKALQMMELEQRYRLRATYYILATAPYYGHFYETGVKRFSCMEEVYKKLAGGGNEIGIHNDLLTVMIKKKLDPMDFNRDELFFYRQLGIPIYGTVAHGSSLASELMSNFNMFSDFATADYVTYQNVTYPIGTYSLLDYGFLYESNFVNFNKYFSESGGAWSGNNTFEDVLNSIENSNPGDRIQILCHPVWWGRE